MDLTTLAREAWRITRSQPTLWILHALLLVAGLPAIIVSAVFGALGTLREIDPALLPGSARALLNSVSPGWAAVIWIVGLALVVLFTAVTQALLAAIYRAAARAMQPGTTVSVRESLALGRARLTRIVALSLTLGAGLSVLSLAPILLVTLGAPVAVGAAIRPILTPVNVVGSLVFLLLVLALSLDDVRGREAPGRAWAVFKRGWVGFVLVMAVTLVWSLAIGLLAVPGILVVTVVWIWPDSGLVAPVISGAVALLCGVPLWVAILGGAAYTNILQTLVYRHAADSLILG